MTTRLSRNLLERAFPDNPMLRGEFEEIDQVFSDAEDRLTALIAEAEAREARLAAVEGAGVQPYSALLASIAELPATAGAIEIVGADEAQVRGIDADDPAALPSRGTVVLYAGKGATGARPAVAADLRAMYLDTTLAAAGKPVFWTGGVWVDATGATV